MVNPLGHWLQIPFSTSSRIPLRGLYRFRVIGLQIPLWGLSGFRPPPGLVVPAGFLQCRISQRKPEALKYYPISDIQLWVIQIWRQNNCYNRTENH